MSDSCQGSSGASTIPWCLGSVENWPNQVAMALGLSSCSLRSRCRRPTTAVADQSGVVLHYQVFVIEVTLGVRLVTDEVAIAGKNLFIGRTAEADGQGDAVILGSTPMGDPRWQVEHIAGLQHPLLLGG